MPWDLAVKAVQAVTDLPWVGPAVSPVIANLFLHYAFDRRMAWKFPGVPFERYVDDAVIHYVSECQAPLASG